MTRRGAAIGSLSLLLFLSACGSTDREGIVVEMLDNRFAPAEATVTARTPITFVGAGRNPHNAVAADGSWSTETAFGSLEQFEGDAATITVESPGTYVFLCTFHGNDQGEGMAGTLTVLPGEDGQ